MRGRSPAHQPQLLIRLVRVHLSRHVPPLFRQKAGAGRRADAGIVEGVVVDAAGRLIGEQGDEPVARVGRKVVHHSGDAAPLVAFSQRPNTGYAEVGQFAVRGILVGLRRADRIDRGELDGDDVIVDRRILAVLRHIQEREGGIAKPWRVCARLGRLDSSVQCLVGLATQCEEVHSSGQQFVRRIEASPSIRKVRAGQVGVPFAEHAGQRHANPENAARVQRLHDFEGRLPILFRRQALTRHQNGFHARVAHPRDEPFERQVGGEFYDAFLHQGFDGGSAQFQIVQVGIDLGIAEDEGKSGLIAPGQLDMGPVRVLRLRREARIERWLVPVEPDARGGFGAVPDDLPFRRRRQHRDRQDGRDPDRCDGLRETAWNDHWGTSSKATVSDTLGGVSSSRDRAGRLATSSEPMNGRV